MNQLLLHSISFTILLSSFGTPYAKATKSSTDANNSIVPVGRYVFIKASANDVDCFGVPQWSAGDVYTAGKKAIYQHKLYRAAYWTQNQVPPNNIFPEGPWVLLGDCK